MSCCITKSIHGETEASIWEMDVLFFIYSKHLFEQRLVHLGYFNNFYSACSDVQGQQNLHHTMQEHGLMRYRNMSTHKFWVCMSQELDTIVCKKLLHLTLDYGFLSTSRVVFMFVLSWKLDYSPGLVTFL
jgi:hypothetical protein